MPSKTRPPRANHRLENQIDRWCTAAEKQIRREPLKAGLVAFGVGLMLTVLPIGRVVTLLVRMVFALLRPVLVVLGAVKLFEEVERRRREEE